MISLSAGDLSRDGVQDVAIGSSDTVLFKSLMAPLYVIVMSQLSFGISNLLEAPSHLDFANDFNGDQHAEIVTAGFKTKDGQSLNISDLSVKGYLLDNNKPQEEFEFMPYQFIQCDNDSTQPVADLNRSISLSLMLIPMLIILMILSWLIVLMKVFVFPSSMALHLH